MKILSLTAMIGFVLLPSSSWSVDPTESPPCEKEAGNLSVCKPNERTQIDADLSAFRQKRPELEKALADNEAKCSQAGTVANAMGARRARAGQTASPTDQSAVINRNVGILRECQRVMNDTTGNYRSMEKTAGERLQPLRAATTGCPGAKKAVYECLQKESKNGGDRAKGKADGYGTVADRLDPQGAETRRRAERMNTGGASGNANGASSGASGNANGGASGNGSPGDQKKGDEKGGQQGGGGPPPDLSPLSQAMKAAQDQKAKEEQERKEAEAKMKAEEARIKNEKIADCLAKKAKLEQAIEECKGKWNIEKAASWVFVKRQECIDEKSALYAPISEFTNCTVNYPQ